MKTSLSNTDHIVRLRFQATEEEVKNLMAAGVLCTTPRVFAQGSKKAVSGGEPYITDGKRKLPYKVAFGWFDCWLYREEMFLMDCPNHQFLKSLVNLLIQKSVAPPAPTVEQQSILVVRKRLKVRNGVPAKRVLTQADMQAAQGDWEALDQHKQERAAQQQAAPEKPADPKLIGQIPVATPQQPKPKKQQKRVQPSEVDPAFVPASTDKLAALAAKFK